MDTLYGWTAIYLSFLMLMSLYRAALGPTAVDRLIGVNAIGSKTVALLILIGLLYHRLDMFIDIALAYGMLNFLAVIAAARYFHKKKRSHEPEA